MKTMENIGCVVGNSNLNLLTGKEDVTGTVLEGKSYEVEYMIYDTGRSIIEKMGTMSLENNEPTLKYFENMFSHRSTEWEFTKLSSFSKLTPIPYVNARIAKPVIVSNADRYEMSFDPLLLDANGILNIYVSVSNDTKKLDFLDVYKNSDAVVVHSLYNTKGFVSAEILNEAA